MEDDAPNTIPDEIFKVSDQPDSSLGDLAYKAFTSNLANIKLNSFPAPSINSVSPGKSEITEQYKYPLGMNNIIVPIEPKTNPIFNMKCVVCYQGCSFNNHFSCKKCGGTICSQCKHASDTLKLLNSKVFYKLSDMHLYCVSCFNMYNDRHKLTHGYELVDLNYLEPGIDAPSTNNANSTKIEEIKNDYIEKLLFLQYKPGYDTNMINLEITRVCDTAVITQDEVNKFLIDCKITKPPKVNVGKLEETEYVYSPGNSGLGYFTKKVSFDSELQKNPTWMSNKRQHVSQDEDYQMPDLNTNYKTTKHNSVEEPKDYQWNLEDEPDIESVPLTGKKYDLDEFVTKRDLVVFKQEMQRLIDSNTDDILTELQAQYENHESQFLSMERKIESLQKMLSAKIDNSIEYMKSVVLQFCSANES